MDGIRGSISPATLSPIEVLGIHARDEAERRRYAERWARLMREDAERILAFQHAYDQAWQRLFPAEPLIDLARLPDEKASDVALQPNDRVLFFTRPDCASCDVLLQRLLKRIDTLAGVDIYLLGLPPDDDTAVEGLGRTTGDRAALGAKPSGHPQSRRRCLVGADAGKGPGAIPVAPAR